MIPMLVWPQEQRLGQMLNRVLAVLEERDMYALPGDVNRRHSDYFLSWNETEDEDEEEDDDNISLSARCNGAGDISSFNTNQQQQSHVTGQQQESEILNGNGNEVPIIVIRPVARRPRRQARRSYLMGGQWSRKLIHGGNGWWLDNSGRKVMDELVQNLGCRNLTQSSSQTEVRDSRSRSRSPPHRHYRHSNSISGTTSQFPSINN